MKFIVLSCTIILLSCTARHFSDDSYNPFEVTTTPDTSKTHYPEEILTFSFNADVGEVSAENIACADSDENECFPTIIASENTISISDLPPQSDVTISFLRSFRSGDNRLLTETTEYGITSKEFSYQFHIGPALPHITSILPQDRASATIALAFSDAVKIQKSNIKPEPVELITEASTAILLYDTPQEKIVLSGLTTPIRPGIIPDFVISEQIKTAVTCSLNDPLITTDDHSVQIVFSGNCLLAFRFEGSTDICQNNRCTIVKDSLTPDSGYSFDVTLFTIDEPIKQRVFAQTKIAEAHIMISEVMHSPSGEPEKNHEFVELYNYTNLPFDLADCLIDDKNDGKGVDPLLGDKTVLSPGSTALIVGNESMIVAPGGGDNLLFHVDDTTIADAGLTSTESLQIICPSETGESIVASYSSSEYGKRGYSVVIEKSGVMCDSPDEGGTPGIYSECQ